MANTANEPPTIAKTQKNRAIESRSIINSKKGLALSFCFSLFAIAAMYYLYQQATSAWQNIHLGIITVLAAFLAVFALELIAANFTRKPLSNKVSLIFAGSLTLVSVVTGLIPDNSFPVSFLSLGFGSAGLAACMLFWFCHVARAKHSRLLIIVDLSLGICAGLGITLAFANNLATTILYAALAVVFFSFFTATFTKADTLNNLKHLSVEKQLNRTNALALLGSGILFTFAHLNAFNALNSRDYLIAVGACMGIGGVALGLIRLKFGTATEDFIYKFTSAIYCIGLFLLPFATDMAVIAVSIYLLLFAFVQLFIVVDAIIETVRIYDLAPIFLICQQWSRIVGGACLITVVYGLLFRFADRATALLITVFILTIFIIIMTAITKSKGYPKQTEGGNEKDEKFTRWSDVFERVQTRYSLSTRELEVLTYLAKGHSSTYIAETLFISTSTARTHIANIYRKMEIHSKEDLLELLEDMRKSR